MQPVIHTFCQPSTLSPRSSPMLIVTSVTVAPLLTPLMQPHYTFHGGIRELAVHISGGGGPAVAGQLQSSVLRNTDASYKSPFPAVSSCSFLPLADQRMHQGGPSAAKQRGKAAGARKSAAGGEEEDRGMVVVGASVIPLTLAQREELGERRTGVWRVGLRGEVGVTGSLRGMQGS